MHFLLPRHVRLVNSVLAPHSYHTFFILIAFSFMSLFDCQSCLLIVIVTLGEYTFPVAALGRSLCW